MLLATLLLATMHVLVRYVGQHMHVLELAFLRNLFGLIAIAPLLVKYGIGVLKTNRPGFHLTRNVLAIVAMWLWFYALTVVPVASATTLSFTSVIFTSLAAMFFLGEVIKARRWFAILLGFIGVIIVLRPGFTELSLGMWITLAASMAWGIGLTFVKHLAKTESVVCIVGWNCILLTLISLVPALFVWQPPSALEWWCMAGIGLLGTLGHLCMTEAFKRADISVVFPLDFLRLVWASIYGWFVFSEATDMWTWIGGAVIFASTCYIAYRESVNKKEAVLEVQ